MKLKNIKASFIFNQDLVEKKSGTGKVHFKEGNVTYTIYKHTPHLLNLTGVKSIGQLKTCKVEMEERFDGEIVEDRVDNLFFSKKDHKNLDMDKLHLYLHEHEKCYHSIKGRKEDDAHKSKTSQTPTHSRTHHVANPTVSDRQGQVAAIQNGKSSTSVTGKGS